MTERPLLWVIIASILLALPLLFFAFGNNNSDTPGDNGNDNNNGEEQNDSENNNDIDPDKAFWGVDSASLTTEELYACVVDNFGTPKVWGRYLGDKENVSFGLTSDEVDYLHSNDVKILLIYNHFSDATGYENGMEQARNAIELAEELEVPEGKAIFADIEPDYPVDKEFIKGWFDGMKDSAYKPGIYGAFAEEQELYPVYSEAAEENEELKNETIIWTAYPQEGITTEENAPEYNPGAPEGSYLLGWQYGIDAEACNIDTNLFKGELFEYLW